MASVKETLIKTNPDYDIVIKQLQLYYDMKLVTSGIDKKRNLIIQFSIFIEPHTALAINFISTGNSTSTSHR